MNKPEATKKTKTTAYLSESDETLLDEVFIKRLRSRNKPDRSALLCEGLRLFMNKNVNQLNQKKQLMKTCKLLFFLAISSFCIIESIPRKSYSYRSKKSYQAKSPCAGFGKVSKTTGKIKTKRTRGYFKPSNGYKFVNQYSRS